MLEERKRTEQFSRLWTRFFAPAGSTDPSVDIAKGLGTFFSFKVAST
jgi:hypothetical protein